MVPPPATSDSSYPSGQGERLITPPPALIVPTDDRPRFAKPKDSPLSSSLDRLIESGRGPKLDAPEVAEAIQDERISSFSLKFQNKILEKEYNDFDAFQNSKRWQRVLLAGGMYFLVSGILNAVLADGDFSTRFQPFVIGAVVAFLWFTNWGITCFWVKSRGWWQGHCAPVVLLVTLVATTALNTEPATLLTDQVLKDGDFIGVVLVMIAFTVSARIRYYPILLTTLLYLILDIVVTVVAFLTTAIEELSGRETFVHYSHLFIASGLLLYANREFELNERRSFVIEARLKLEQGKLISKNRALVSLMRSPSKEGSHSVLDTTTPLERVIRILEGLQESATTTEQVQISNALKMLQDKQALFVPKIDAQLSRGSNQHLDSETRAYVREFIPAGRPRSRRGSFASPESGTLTLPSKSRRGSVIGVVGYGKGGSKAALTPSSSIMSIADLQAIGEMHEFISNWNFDIFEYNRVSHNKPLAYIGQEIFSRLKFAENLGVSAKTYANFLLAADSGYRALPYHCNIHGADVMHAMYLFTTSCHQVLFTPAETLALVTAAAIHDMDHPGVNNAFLTHTMSDLAILYNDRSPLEAYHLGCAFTLLQLPDCDFFQELPDEAPQHVRKLMIELVYATDMSYHFEALGEFRSLLGMRGDSGMDWNEASDRLTFMKILMKAADLSNPTKKWELHESWTNRYFEETFAQGDLEFQASIPVSPFMDRTTTLPAKCEVGFFSFIVVPFWEVAAPHFGSLTDTCLNALKDNLERWQEKQKEETPPPEMSQEDQVKAHAKAALLTSRFIIGANLPSQYIKVPQADRMTGILAGFDDMRLSSPSLGPGPPVIPDLLTGAKPPKPRRMSLQIGNSTGLALKDIPRLPAGQAARKGSKNASHDLDEAGEEMMSVAPFSASETTLPELEDD